MATIAASFPIHFLQWPTTSIVTTASICVLTQAGVLSPFSQVVVTWLNLAGLSRDTRLRPVFFLLPSVIRLG